MDSNFSSMGVNEKTLLSFLAMAKRVSEIDWEISEIDKQIAALMAMREKKENEKIEVKSEISCFDHSSLFEKTQEVTASTTITAPADEVIASSEATGDKTIVSADLEGASIEKPVIEITIPTGVFGSQEKEDEIRNKPLHTCVTEPEKFPRSMRSSSRGSRLALFLAR